MKDQQGFIKGHMIDSYIFVCTSGAKVSIASAAKAKLVISPCLTIFCISEDVPCFENNQSCSTALPNVDVYLPFTPPRPSGLNIQAKPDLFRSFNFVLIWFISAILYTF